MDYELLPCQEKLMGDDSPFAGIYGGRGCGKTFLLSCLGRDALINGKNVMIWGQTLTALENVLFANIKQRFSEIGLFDELAINTRPQPKITFRGHTLYGFTYENLDACRGYSEISLALYDEIATAPNDLMAVAAPCLRGNGIVPHSRFASTPRPGSYWDTLFRSPDMVAHVYTGTIYENNNVSDEQRAEMERAITDERLRRVELYGEILDIGNDSQVIRLAEFPTKAGEFADERVFVGIDCAGLGVDNSVICVRKGNRILGIHSQSEMDGYECKRKVREMLGNEKPSGIFIDMAYGQSYYDQLKYEYQNVNLVQFASAPEKPERFANKRAEMYFDTADAIRDGLLVEDAEIKREMCCTHFFVNRRNRIQLQEKDEIKAILGHSPDKSDALVLTYADGYNREYGVTVQAKTNATLEEKRRKGRSWMG